MGFELDPTYKDVPTRIGDLKEKHPKARLRPVNPAEPYRIECINGVYFVAYVAACYESPDDTLPGIGCAWEPFPGTTPYTRNSELMNAETSAWGRAIVAALASESKSVASAEDVRNRQADGMAPPDPLAALPVKAAKEWLLVVAGGDKDACKAAWTAAGLDGRTSVNSDEMAAAFTALVAPVPVDEPAADVDPDPTSTPAPPDVVAEWEHEVNQLGEIQTAALAVWLNSEGIDPAEGMTRAQAVAAIGKARELRSRAAVEAEAEPADQEATP